MKAPAFLFYIDDYRGSRVVQRMTWAQRGMYVEMLCEQADKGSLPDDPQAVADLLGGTVEEWEAAWPILRRRFVDRRARRRRGDEGPIPADHDASRRIINLKMDDVLRKRQTFIDGRKSAGRVGGVSKAKKQRELSSGTARAHTGTATNLASTALANSSFQTGSRTDLRRTENVQETTALASSGNGSEPDDVSQRAGRFCEETYPELYAKFRKGARYVGRPALDFQEALLLCRTWDDERLSKLAQVFLTTDHEFAEKGSRSMAQFRAMASWCDGRLREAGL